MVSKVFTSTEFGHHLEGGGLTRWLRSEEGIALVWNTVKNGFDEHVMKLGSIFCSLKASYAHVEWNSGGRRHTFSGVLGVHNALGYYSCKIWWSDGDYLSEDGVPFTLLDGFIINRTDGLGPGMHEIAYDDAQDVLEAFKPMVLARCGVDSAPVDVRSVPDYTFSSSWDLLD